MLKLKDECVKDKIYLKKVFLTKEGLKREYPTQDYFYISDVEQMLEQFYIAVKGGLVDSTK